MPEPTISLWQRQGPLAGRAADAVVIGAGIAGLSAALEFQRRGLSCIVLESRAPAAAASGRNAGFLMRGAADNYAAAVRTYGRATAAALWRWTEDNLADLKALGIADLPSTSARASCLLALDEREQRELAQSAELLAADGFDVELIEPGGARAADTIWSRARPRLGLLNPHDAVCNPVELVGLLCAQLDAAELYTGCHVAAIERRDDDALTLLTSLGVLTARRVLVATNAAAPRLLPCLSRLVTPNRGQMLALHAPDVRLDFAYYANHGSEYLRQLDANHVILGGARLHDEAAERTDSESVSDAIQSRLEQIAREWLTDDLRVSTRWAGVMAFSPDHLPLAGPVPLAPGAPPDSDLWFVGAFTGHGMSMGHRTATAAARAMLDTDAPLPPWLRISRLSR